MLGSNGKFFGDMAGLQVQFFENGLYNNDQLRQRVAFALSEIWVVSKDGNISYAAAFPPLLNIFQHDAFGSYSQLIHDVTLNPAMGHYLDMVNNRKAADAYLPNENYGREVMQLFTLGLSVLNPDGSVVLSKGAPLVTYDQSTVAEISAALTGWTYAPVATGGTPPNYYLPMVVYLSGGQETRHDQTKKVLNFYYPDGANHPFTIDAGRTAEQELQKVIGALMENPTMAPFISQQLIEHLVTSNPSPGYISRVANVFTSTSGNLEKVIYAILTDCEAREGDLAGGDPVSFGHLREPVLWLENLLRGLNGTVYDSSSLYNVTTDLGQQLFYPPSVFSYFAPDYHVGALVGPEFQLDNVSTVLGRANYTYNLIYNSRLDAGTTFDISAFVTKAGVATPALIAAINAEFFHDQMSAVLQKAITDGIMGQTTPAEQAQAALYIALTSSEYLIIH